MGKGSTANALPRTDDTSVRGEHLSSFIPLWYPVLLGLPAFFPLIICTVLTWRRGLIPTAFLQPDMPYYLANARQHFVQGFHFTYSNPFAHYGSPNIYFQPQILLLGLLQRMGLDPSSAWVAFHLASVLFASVVATKLYEFLVGWGTPSRKLGLVCFFWGGGLLSLLGLALGLTTRVLFGKFHYFGTIDPSSGWWMLNFGRNLTYPTEAYYHGLYLLSILLLLKKRFGWALCTTVVLCVSHPFSGLSLVLVVILFSATELLLKSDGSSPLLLAGSIAIAIAHLAYYKLFLDIFPDHRVLESQWRLKWTYDLRTFVPALCLVGVFAFIALTRLSRPRLAFADIDKRLCLIWFAVIFALSHHDWFIQPQQPIHFAHGYDWIALYFLGAPAIVGLFGKLLTIQPRLLMVLTVGVVLVLFVSDNLLWFSTFFGRTMQTPVSALTPAEKDVLDWLSHHAGAPEYVVSSDQKLNYLVSAYANVRDWYGHVYNTPFAAARKDESEAAFLKGVPLPTSNPVLYIPERSLRWKPPTAAALVYSNNSFEIWRIPEK